VLAPHGVALSWADYRRFIAGHPNGAIAARFLPHVPGGDHGAIIDDKEARYRALVTAVEPAAGLLDLLDWADTRAIPYAVVTNAPRANAELVLRGLGIRSRIGALVAGDEVDSPKPHPMPYLKAAAAVNGDLARTVAFEDSGSGVASAVAAGLPVVGLAAPADEGGLAAKGAALVIADFRDPGLMGFLRGRLGLDGAR
jgi:HAD superfamily hydrolase (TIGR01509 family)